MAKGNMNREVYYDRLKQLSGGSSKKNGGTVTSTLIDFKKGGDGVNYGIVKENHKYFIKQSKNKSEKMSASDFTYLGGLENKMNYSYNTLAEADKDRNFMLISLNESYKNTKFDSAKLKLINENFKVKEGEEEADIDAAAKALDSLESNPETEIPSGDAPKEDMPSAPAPEAETSTEPAPETSAVEPEMSAPTEPEAETSTEPAPETDKAPDESSDEVTQSKKLVGKLQNIVSNADLSPTETVAQLKQIIAGYSDNLVDVEDDKKTELVNKIKGAEPTEDKPEEIAETDENVDSPFIKYVKECGYEPSDMSNASIMEVAALINSWANKDGVEDQDIDTVADFVTPEVENEVNESGNSQFLEKVKAKGKKAKFKYESLEPKPLEIDEMMENGEESEVSDMDSDMGDDVKFGGVDTMTAPTPLSLPPQSVQPSTTTLSVDLNNKLVNLNITESQLRKYIKNEISKRKGLKVNVNESVEIADSDLKKEIDAAIDTELKENDGVDTGKTSIVDSEQAVNEQNIKKLIAYRLDERKGKVKTTLFENFKNSELLKEIDKAIDDITKK